MDVKIQDLNTCIEFKQKRIEQSKAVNNFKECDQVCEEVAELKDRRNELKTELRDLECKEKESAWYKTVTSSKCRVLQVLLMN